MTNIALVDDESNILISVSLALRTEGFNVDTFKNGEEAIQGLENKKYDLGLFDIKMPRMNGNELLIKVRSSNNLELRNMPIIFLTSKDQEQDEIIGLKMGAADYIKKPFSQKLLNERIRTVLRVHANRINVENKKEDNNQNLKKGDLLLDDLKQLCFWKNQVIELTGTITGNQIVTFPTSTEGMHVVFNNTSGGYESIEFTWAIEYLGHESFDDYTVVASVPGTDGNHWLVEFHNGSGQWNTTASFEMGLENALLFDDLHMRVTPPNQSVARSFTSGHSIALSFSTVKSKA